MINIAIFQRNVLLKTILFAFVFSLTNACSNDTDIMTPEEEQMEIEEQKEEENESETSCAKENMVFGEAEGLLNIEFENAVFTDDWELKSEGDNFTGTGYMVWTGDQYLSSPGNGKVTFTLNITTPGTYRMIWRSSVTIGDSGSDHNDSWLRFPDADDFYGQKDDSVVYPVGSGKTPNPDGASKEGWFKIYRSGSDLDFKWQSSTSDHDGHSIYVVFNSAREYTMEVSGRSTGHAIDRFVLFTDAYSQADATAETVMLSATNCD